MNLDNRIPLKIVPRSQGILKEDIVKYTDATDVGIEDFLGRRVVKHDVQEISKFYKDKKVLIIGGAGSIGSEITRQLLELDAKKIIVYDNSEYLIFTLDQSLKELQIDKRKYSLIIGNILNYKKLDSVISVIKPDVVFHAAAYKHVYLMEKNPDEAVINNVMGTKNVIDISIRNNVAEFVFISTDKVVNPTNIMGATKKIMEYYIEDINHFSTKINIVRFGNVINSNGSVLPTFLRQIDELKYVTVTHPEIKRFFMSLREASRLVINSLIISGQGEIYVLDMGELINIREVAQCTIRSKGYIPDKDVIIKYIGLKSGEKLVEELYTDDEKRNLIDTGFTNIRKLKNKEKSKKKISVIIKELLDLVNYQDPIKLKSYLKSIFPTLKLN